MKAAAIRLTLLFLCAIGGAAIGHTVFPYLKPSAAPDFLSRFPAEGTPAISLLFGTIESFDPSSRIALISLDNPYDPRSGPLLVRAHIGQGAQVQLRSDIFEPSGNGKALTKSNIADASEEDLKLRRRAMLSIRRLPGSIEAMSVILEDQGGS